MGSMENTGHNTRATMNSLHEQILQIQKLHPIACFSLHVLHNCQKIFFLKKLIIISFYWLELFLLIYCPKSETLSAC